MYSKMAISACLRVCHDRRHQFSLDGFEECFDGGIIVAIALAAHRYLKPMQAQDLLIIMRTILAASIRVVNAAFRWGRRVDLQGAADRAVDLLTSFGVPR